MIGPDYTVLSVTDMNTVTVIIAVLAVWEIVEIYFHSSLFAGARARVELWESGWYRQLLECPFCLSPWVALLVVLTLDLGASLEACGPRWLGLWIQAPVVALAVARAANVTHDLMVDRDRTPKGDELTMPPKQNEGVEDSKASFEDSDGTAEQ